MFEYTTLTHDESDYHSTFGWHQMNDKETDRLLAGILKKDVENIKEGFRPEHLWLFKTPLVFVGRYMDKISTKSKTLDVFNRSSKWLKLPKMIEYIVMNRLEYHFISIDQHKAGREKRFADYIKTFRERNF